MKKCITLILTSLFIFMGAPLSFVQSAPMNGDITRGRSQPADVRDPNSRDRDARRSQSATEDKINAQLVNMPREERELYNVKLEPGMNMTIKSKMHPLLKDIDGDPILYGKTYSMTAYKAHLSSSMEVKFEKGATKWVDGLPENRVEISMGPHYLAAGITSGIARRSFTFQFFNSTSGSPHIPGSNQWIPIVPSAGALSCSDSNYFAFKNDANGLFLGYNPPDYLTADSFFSGLGHTSFSNTLWCLRKVR